MEIAQRRPLAAAEIERLRDAAQRILPGRPEVVAAYLYGSAARGEPARDVDVGLVLRQPAREPFWLEQLASELQRQGGPAGLEIDLRPLAGTGPRFRANVVREGRLLYEADTEARIEFEVRAISEWLDFKPDWERLRRAMLEGWARE